MQTWMIPSRYDFFLVAFPSWVCFLFCFVSSQEAKAAIDPKIHATIRKAKAYTLKVRGYQMHLDKERFHLEANQKTLAYWEARYKKENSGKPLKPAQMKSLERLRNVIEEAKKRVVQFEKYLFYLDKRQKPLGSLRWDGQIFYHPQHGLLQDYREGALLIESLEAWREVCQKNKPLVRAPQKVTVRQISWAKKVWDVEVFQNFSSLARPHPLHLNEQYVSLYPTAQFLHNACHAQPFFLWDISEKRLVQLPPPPLDALFSKHPSLLPWLQGLSASVTVQLLSYDPKKKEAYLLFLRPYYAVGRKDKQGFLLRWDLATQEITALYPLPKSYCLDSFFFDAQKKRLFILAQEHAIPSRCFSPSVEDPLVPPSYRSNLWGYSLEKKNLERLAPLLHEHTLYKYRWSPSKTKLAILEYNIRYKRPTYAFLLDLKKQMFHRYLIGNYNYALSYAKDQRSFFVGGADTGEIYRFSIHPKKKKRSAKVGMYLHAVGISRDGEVLYAIRHQGVYALSSKELKQLDFLPIKELLPNEKYPHVGGSMVEGGTIFLMNRSQDLFILSPRN
jgi:hypothetical protein